MRRHFVTVATLSTRTLMAKPRRAKTRPSAKIVRSKPPATVRAVASRPAPKPAPPAPPPKPPVRASYLEAVALYEQGVAALQEHDYPRASSVLACGSSKAA